MNKKEEFKQKQYEEGVRRLKLLQVVGKVTQDLRKKDKDLYFSERQNKYFNAVLYTIKTNRPEWYKFLRKWEEETNNFIYHCQLTHFEFGDVLSVMYVSDDELEWSQDRLDLRNGEAFVVTFQVTETTIRQIEYGYIGVRASMGGVARTY